MYEEHFGLKKRPFSEKATGTEVFVGPQTAKTMAGFRKALAVQDAVVTVSGPVGTGKTTLVERALDAIGTRYKTIRVGRMQMNSSDVLESVLVVLGVQDRPNGTIQRFAALRRKLKELQDAETRVFILVEDAMRAGAETLAELEALTVADAGESDGASIVLMGDERLFDFMRDPQLARLQQRIRQRHKIKPLCVAEMLGYLKHSFRMAGGDYERVFDARSAELLHQLSDGIPRIANNLVESVLAAAAAEGMDKIPATFIASVAADEFGLSADGFDFSAPEPVAEDAPDPEPVVDIVAEPAPEPAPVVDVAAAPEPTIPEEPQPVIVFADDAEKPTEKSQDVPHLIQDTLPDLAILSKRYATLLQDDAEEIPEVVADLEEEPAVEILPELKPEPMPAPEPVAAVTPDALPEPILEPESVAEIIPELVPEPLPTLEPVAAVTPEVLPEPILEPESVAEIIPELEPEPVPASEPVAAITPEVLPEPILEPEPTAEITPELEPEQESSPELVDEFAREFEPGPVIALEPAAEIIPELAPEPEPMPEPEPVSEVIPEPELEPTPDVVSEATPTPEPPAEVAAPQSADDDLPEWDRDPTFAQLKPDLEALEQAMAFAHGAPLEAKPDAPVQPESLSDSVGEKEEIPEITLDNAIETGVQDHLIEEPSDIQPPKPAQKPDVELDRIAANIASAKTLDDIDDIMAETLFGTGISMIAAQITANPPSDESANDELQLLKEPSPEAAPLLEEPPAVKQAHAIEQPGEEISIETSPPMANSGMDLSASQRLKTVRALNADLHPSLREPEKAPGANSPAASNEPQPIEDQINTSITQTLKGLKLPPELMDDEPEEEETKSGFFSRFRRS